MVTYLHGACLMCLLLSQVAAQTIGSELENILSRLEDRSVISSSEQQELIAQGLELNPDEASAARLWLRRGDLFLDDGDGKSARPCLERAETLAISVGDATLHRATAIALGTAYSWVGEGRRAIERFEVALQMDEESGNTVAQIKLLSNIGLAYRDLAELGKAVASFTRAVELLGDEPEPHLHAQLLTNIGAVHNHSRDAQQAKWFLSRALAIMEELQEPTRYVTLISLGSAHALEGEHTMALKLNQQAIGLAADAHDDLMVESARVNIAMAYAGLGKHTLAVEQLETASDWLRKHNCIRELAIAQIGLGIAFEATGQPAAAKRAFAEARQIARSSDDRALTSEALVQMARMHGSTGNHARALELVREAHGFLRSWHANEQQVALEGFEKDYQHEVQTNRLHSLESDQTLASLELERSRASRSRMIGLSLFSLASLAVLLLLARGRSCALTRLRTEDASLRAHRDQLEVAFAEVETLRGLLPICSHCKQIRDADGRWAPVETFFGERADVSFSHSLCPPCSIAPLQPELSSNVE